MTTHDKLITAIASADPEYAHDPDAVLADRGAEIDRIAAGVEAAGFTPTAGAAHSVDDRQKLSDAVCIAVDQDFEDYASYVQDGDRAAHAPIVDSILNHGFGLPR